MAAIWDEPSVTSSGRLTGGSSDRFKAMYIEDHFEIELSEESWAAVFKGARYALSLLPAISFGSFASDQWLYGLALLDPVDFNKVDSIFGLDFGFYVFQLPLIDITSNWAQFLVFITLLITTVQHLARDILFGGGYEKLHRCCQSTLACTRCILLCTD